MKNQTPDYQGESALEKEWFPNTTPSPTEKLLVQSLYLAGLTNDIRGIKQSLQTLLRYRQYLACTTETAKFSIINKDWS
jgi:hypothetical protein